MYISLYFNIAINIWKEYLEYVIEEYNTSKEEDEEPLLNVNEIQKLCQKAISMTKFDLTNVNELTKIKIYILQTIILFNL